MRSIARRLTACRRSTSSSSPRFGSLRDVQQRLRERQRRAQLVRRVGRESLLFGDVCLEAREQAVDGVGEILQLVAGPGER